MLLTTETCQKTTGDKTNIIELLAMPDADKTEFNPPSLKGKKLYRPEDFT